MGYFVEALACIKVAQAAIPVSYHLILGVMSNAGWVDFKVLHSNHIHTMAAFVIINLGKCAYTR